MVVTLVVQNGAHARLLNIRAETCNATLHLRGTGAQEYQLTVVSVEIC